MIPQETTREIYDQNNISGKSISDKFKKSKAHIRVKPIHFPRYVLSQYLKNLQT